MMMRRRGPGLVRGVARTAVVAGTAGVVVDRWSDATAVEQEDRLAAVLTDRAEPNKQQRQKRVAAFPPQVDDLHQQQRPRKPAAQLDPLEPCPALGP